MISEKMDGAIEIEDGGLGAGAHKVPSLLSTSKGCAERNLDFCS